MNRKIFFLTKIRTVPERQRFGLNRNKTISCLPVQFTRYEDANRIFSPPKNIIHPKHWRKTCPRMTREIGKYILAVWTPPPHSEFHCLKLHQALPSSYLSESKLEQKCGGEDTQNKKTENYRNFAIFFERYEEERLCNTMFFFCAICCNCCFLQAFA